jgi:glutathione transport system permease protein
MPEDGAASRGASAAGATGTAAPARTPRRRSAWRRLLRHPSGSLGLFLSLAFVAMAIVGPYVTPYDPNRQDYRALNAGISAEHWLGTDQFGRDTFSRVVAGARTSIGIGLAATLIGAVVGGLWGLWAGYLGGGSTASPCASSTCCWPSPACCWRSG